jgi:hypothetical protein
VSMRIEVNHSAVEKTHRVGPSPSRHGRTAAAKIGGPQNMSFVENLVGPTELESVTSTVSR